MASPIMDGSARSAEGATARGADRQPRGAEKGYRQMENSGGRTPEKGKEFFAPPGAEKGSSLNREYRIQPKAVPRTRRSAEYLNFML